MATKLRNSIYRVLFDSASDFHRGADAGRKLRIDIKQILNDLTLEVIGAGGTGSADGGGIGRRWQQGREEMKRPGETNPGLK